MKNLDFIIYFCESIMIAHKPDIFLSALGVNNDINNGLQINFIQNQNFCNEFISSKESEKNKEEILNAKKQYKYIT